MTKIEEIDRVISDFLTKTLRVENDKVKIIKTFQRQRWLGCRGRGLRGELIHKGPRAPDKGAGQEYLQSQG